MPSLGFEPPLPPSYHFDVLCDKNEVDAAKSQLSYAQKRADHCPEKINISTELCTEKCRSLINISTELCTETCRS